MRDRTARDFSRRERQIMEIIWGRGEATAAEVLEALPDPPTYSAVRSTLRILEEKGHLTHRRDGQRFVFEPTLPAGAARRTALRQLVGNLFGGSTEEALAGLLDLSEGGLSEQECERMIRLIQRARREGR